MKAILLRDASNRASRSTSWKTAPYMAEVVSRPQYINTQKEVILAYAR